MLRSKRIVKVHLPRVFTMPGCFFGCWGEMKRQGSTQRGWSNSPTARGRWDMSRVSKINQYNFFPFYCKAFKRMKWLVKFPLIFLAQGTILKAWIDVTSGKDAYARKAGKYFDEGLKEKADVFALMGKVRWERQILKAFFTAAANVRMLSFLLFSISSYCIVPIIA